MGQGLGQAPLTSEGEGLCFSPRNGAYLKSFQCRSLQSPPRGGARAHGLTRSVRSTLGSQSLHSGTSPSAQLGCRLV